jgi:coenzyme F420-0:L-glutamate ligase/coenzyme F420-1:gamma-L-glutamate ligase
MKKIEILGLQAVPEIKAGDNLAQIICDCAKNENVGINEKDIFVLTSKIVSKALGLTRKKADVKVSKKAAKISKRTGKDPIWVQMILDAGHKIIAVIPLEGAITKYIVNGSTDAESSQRLCDNEKCIFITKSKTGSIHTCDAGIDGSNHPAGVVSLLPERPDDEARKIREQIQKLSGKQVAVILADTEMIPFGTMDFAVGSSGIEPVSKMFGDKDLFGKPKFGGIDLTVHELTAASTLVFGQTAGGIAAAVIRGCEYQISETANIANSLASKPGSTDVTNIIKVTLRATAHAKNLKSRLLLRIASWFV